MKRIKYIVFALIAMFIFSSCATYNAPTRYQGRNLYKFDKTKRTVKQGKARGTKFYAVKHRTSYRHPAVPNWVRKDIRRRSWMEDSGAGQSSK